MKMLLNIVIALIAFGGAAGASWYLNNQEKPEEELTQPTTNGDKRVPPANDAGPSEGEKTAELPRVAKARPASPEEMFRFTQMLNQRETALKARASSIEVEENRLKIMLRDIRTEQAAFDGLHKQLKGDLETGDKLLAEIGEKWTKLDALQKQNKQDAEKPATKTDADPTTIRKMAGWFKSMDPQDAGKYLQEMANDGKLETAAKILFQLEERDAASIIPAISDKTLGQQLLSKVLEMKKPAKPKRN